MAADDKSVTDEGIPADLDLGKASEPTPEDHESLDSALDAAGIFDDPKPPKGEDDPKPPAGDPEPPKGEDEDPKPPVGDPEPPKGEDDPKPPSDEEAARKEQDRIKDLESIDLEKLKAPEDISPRNVVNFNKLREVAGHYKQQAARVPELEKTVADLQAKVGSPDALPEDLRREFDELRNFRRIFDTENDPEFRKEISSEIRHVF